MSTFYMNYKGELIEVTVTDLARDEAKETQARNNVLLFVGMHYVNHAGMESQKMLMPKMCPFFGKKYIL